MNKKQLMVAWLGGITISVIALLVPRVAYHDGSLVTLDRVHTYSGYTLAAVPNWSLILSLCVPVLVVGGLIIYVLRNRK